MKHPALTRLFSVVLVILCLTMLFAGLGNAYGAIREQKKRQDEADRLQGRIDEYRQVLEALEGTTKYDEVNLSLQERQESHEEQASQHRTDLAIYTATRSGLQTGAAALQEAMEQLAAGKQQYWAGRALFEEQAAAFEEGYAQFQEGKRQLEEGRKTLALAGEALSGLRSQVEQSKALAAILESEDPDARQQLSLGAYDSMLTALDNMTGLYRSLKDQGGISAEQVQMLAQMLLQQADPDSNAEELLQGIEWQGITAEDLDSWETQVREATGMSMEEIRAAIQEQRDSIAGLDGEEPLSEEQFAALQAMYAQSRQWTAQVTENLDTQLAEYEAKLREAQSQMEEAQAQIDEMDAYMEQAKAAIEQGRAALDYAGWQLQQGETALLDGQNEMAQKEAELEEQAEQLRLEKLELDEQTQELDSLSAEARAQRELEQRETSLRLILLGRPEIKERAENGMNLELAAQDYADTFRFEADRQTQGRLRVSILMLVGAVAGFVGIPAAFEKTRSRFWLLAPVLVCLGCAVAAEVLCRVLGRGDSYSALAAAIFAAIQLMISAPKKKA